MRLFGVCTSSLSETCISMPLKKHVGAIRRRWTESNGLTTPRTAGSPESDRPGNRKAKDGSSSRNMFRRTSRMRCPGTMAGGVRKQPECQRVGVTSMRLFGLFFHGFQSIQSKILDRSISGHSNHERSRSGHWNEPPARSVRTSAFMAA